MDPKNTDASSARIFLAEERERERERLSLHHRPKDCISVAYSPYADGCDYWYHDTRLQQYN